MSIINETLSQIKKATDYQLNKKILREKVKSDLHVTHAGGLFLITPALLTFLTSFDVEYLVVEDVYENPVKVNRQEFLNVAKERYLSITDSWFNEHEKLRTIRRI